MTIVAIGGGEIKDKETLEIDREIVELTEKDSPEALFVPTASDDAEGYIETFQRIYGNKLGCKTDVLKLVEEDTGQQEVREKIEEADLIYVGGGNTNKMLEIWKDKNIDRYLKKAEKNGTVLSGLSAGAICWFQKYHTDSESFEVEDGEEWSFMISEGMGYIQDFLAIPHYLEEQERKKDIQAKISDIDENILAIDDYAALMIDNGGYKVLRSRSEAEVYLIRSKNGAIEEEELEKGDLDNLKNNSV